ncbi:citrate/2-methylcitrate synthase [Spirochaeta cellobiosiphila]|uniref:citrate/2-methylcitrate synthase n=1 Tax=Spirochaeta cellobiosiphila TaxID=504483 RepID=UPI00040851CF|nr:citrate/2-methylcitrate synthase [Spirochaeta cellobiosiphila]
MDKTSKLNSFLERYTNVAQAQNKIDPRVYEKWNVKRGLRNSDGTGVVVGLTEVGEVHGYIMDEGDKVPAPGRLLYRGYDVKDLVTGFQKDKRYGFEEATYLLLFGSLPTSSELAEFTGLLSDLRELPNGLIEDSILKFPSRNIMNKLARTVLVYYSYDEDPENLSISNILRQSVELIARFPVLTAYSYQAMRYNYYNDSLFLHPPQPELSTAENFLYMVRQDSQFTPLEAELLDLALVLHAEHGGGNNSTFSIHLVSSAETDTYSSIGAAIGSLKGRKHGGANIKVWEMFQEIKLNVQNWEDDLEVSEYLAKLLKGEAFDHSGLIYGMGHAVYTLSDPRAELIKEKARELAKEKGREEEFELYNSIERLTPEVFADVKGYRKEICANVDFYTGFVYDMLNIPPELYTPIFAIARIAGWCAHRVEELVSGGKIIRPAYKAVHNRRDYLDMESRISEE